MFIYENDIPSFFEPFDIPHRGVVVDNADPQHLGRVKCTIDDLFDSTDETILPWIYPWNPATSGGKTNSGSFAVPQIGTELVIEFKYRDIYFPFYTGYWQSNLTHQADFDTNYPKTYGNRDEKGNISRTDMTAGTTEYIHHSSYQTKFQNNGDYEIGKATLELIVQATKMMTKYNALVTWCTTHTHPGGVLQPAVGPTPLVSETEIASAKHKVGD